MMQRQVPGEQFKCRTVLKYSQMCKISSPEQSSMSDTSWFKLAFLELRVALETWNVVTNSFASDIGST